MMERLDKARSSHPQPLRLAGRVDAFTAGGSTAWEVHYAATEMRARGRDVIILTIGDPDFDTPEPIVDAAMASLHRGETHYTPAAGIPQLGKVIAEAETKRLGRPIENSQIVVTQGAQNGLYGIMQCLANPGDEVISIDPAYPTFSGVIGGAGADMVRAALAFDGEQFHLDMTSVKQARSERTRVVLLNFPHNPTGAMLNETEAREIAGFCRDHGIWLVCDEVYAELCFDRPYASPASFAEHAAHTISVRSFSKSHAMSGWRVGWVVAPDHVAFNLQNLMNCMLFGGAEFIQRGAVAALGLDAATQMRDAYHRRRDLLFDALSNQKGVRPLSPQSGVFMLADVRGTGLSSTDFAWRLLKEHNVAVMPADSFSPLTEGFVRLSLCVPDDELAEAGARIGRLAAAVSG